MDKVTALLKNPVVRTGLKIASPELAIGVEVALALVQSMQPRKPDITELLKIIDKKLASILEQLSEEQPLHYKRELEIRAHQLLEIIVEWNKINVAGT